VRVLLLAGARPQFIKSAALLPALRRQADVTFVHSGQHADPRMVETHFAGLGLPEPDLRLDPTGSAARLDSMVDQLSAVLAERRPDWVVVMGDTESTLAGARAAARARIRLAHVEAGARSGEPDLPEERIRIEVDEGSDLLLCSTPAHAANLTGREGVEVVGDVMADVLLANAQGIRAEAPPAAVPYAVLTMHRAATADDPERLGRVLGAISRSSRRVVFPVHPRTARSLPAAPPGIETTPPESYLRFLGLVSCADVVLTDSGGLQKEAYLLGVPCITLRDATEWGETIDVGWNVLAGTDPDRILAALADPPRSPERPALYGDGRAAERVAAALTSA
jgi:UDP-N-acetylglucosamine 2-epimerase